MKNIELIKEEMNRNGWSKINLSLSSEDVNFFKSEAIEQKNKDIKKFGEDFLKKNSYFDILKCQFKFEKQYIDILESKWLNLLVDNLLNSESILYDFFMLLNNEKQQNHNRNNFHRDQSYLGGLRASFLVIIPLIDFKEEIGPTEIIAGSHLIEAKPSTEFIESNITKLIANTGEVIVIDAALWHRAGLNKTNSWRPAIILRFQLPFLKRHINLSTNYSNEIQNSSELIQKRLGLNCNEFTSLEQSLTSVKTNKGQYNIEKLYYNK